jgi:molybdate transport system ATP-binding protein
MLRVSALKKRDGFTLDAKLEAPTPGIVALFGRSGCGKTTLVNVISGLLPADNALVQLDDVVLTDTAAGVSVPVERRRIGYVFQDGRLFPHLSVVGNLRYGLKRCPEKPFIAFDEVVDLLGLSRLLTRRPHQLSGGERQRVGLGRALLCQPRMLLLDEPLAALDVARREEVLPYLEALRDRLSMPMVYVSHQFEEVLQLATHVVLMDSGRVVAQGSLSEVSLLPELRTIVGPDAAGSVLEGVVTQTDPTELRLGNGSLRITLKNAAVGLRVRVQLLARDIIIATDRPHALSVRNVLEGVLTEIIPDEEDAVLVKVDVGAGAIVLSRITLDAAEALNLHPGMSVWALVKAVSTRGHAYRIKHPE